MPHSTFSPCVAQSPHSYFEHAEAINAIAKRALRIETRDASYIARKISLGLSLQAAELVGKGILVIVAHSPKETVRRHRFHDVLALLQDAERQINNRPEQALIPFQRFLQWRPEFDGFRYTTTIEVYLQEHFTRGMSAKSRNYFYPDFPTFAGPCPIQALAVIVDYLIQVGIGIEAAVAPSIRTTL